MSTAEFVIQLALRRQKPAHVDPLLERGVGLAQDFGRAQKGDLDLHPSSLEQGNGLIQIVEALRIGADIAVHHHLDRALLPRLGRGQRSISREGQQLGIATVFADTSSSSGWLTQKTRSARSTNSRNAPPATSPSNTSQR